MQSWNTLLNDGELDISVKNEFIRCYQEAKEKLKSYGIVMDEEADFMFANHILALLKRVKARSFVEDMEEEDFEQVPKDVYDMAEDIVKGLFEKEHLPINQTEVFLVATHIEITIQKTKGGTEQ
ncbi:PRD domain-containing protein [Caproiciproducens faecalis]|uniref:PRD domain-containing protein n=1 Tax=Caproiciproducens faecalis TaxID=2820301 RepID=A0ABS7DKX9_9FIRM|nr:PRD domain-containing protein [Caproiciproducens faecalis]